MWNCKNGIERHRHQTVMSELLREEQHSKDKMREDIEKIRAEMSTMLAYRHVYRKFSISRHYREPPTKEQSLDKEPRGTSCRKVSIRTNSRDQQEEMPRHNRLPHLCTLTPQHAVTSPDYKDTYRHRHSSQSCQSSQMLKYNVPDQQSEVHQPSLLPKPRRPHQHVPATQRNHSEPQRRGQPPKRGRHSETWKPRRQTSLPEDCCTTYSLRRFIDAEAQLLWTRRCPAARRRRHSERLLRASRLPQIVDRLKPTSAIFRDFRRYMDATSHRQRSVDAQSQEVAKPRDKD